MYRNALDTVVVTVPATEPVSKVNAKLALGLTDAGSDTFVDACIAGARGYVEKETQRKLITQTHSLYIGGWPSAGQSGVDPEGAGDYIQLPFGNIQSITHIKYRDTGGTWQTWADTNYVLDNTHISGRVYAGYNIPWPTSALYVGNPIEVKFVCGYGGAGDVPPDLISAVQLAIGELFNNRRFDPKDDGLFQLLIADYRITWL